MSNLKNRTVMLFVSCFYTGYFPFASGTFTTLVVAVPVYLALSLLPTWAYLSFIVLLTLLSAYLCGEAERILDKKDPGKATIDEVVGYLITMAFLPNTWLFVTVGFFLFRAFDVLKVFPANWVEKKVPGGWGVTLDDVVSGIWPNLLIHVLMALNILSV